MPQRTREHELDEEGKFAFDSVCKKSWKWLSREFVPDYAFDRQVQICKDGYTTSLFFNAQIKATDKMGASHDVPVYSFETEWLRHYRDCRFHSCWSDMTQRMSVCSTNGCMNYGGI